jgi:hypothetical protein
MYDSNLLEFLNFLINFLQARQDTHKNVNGRLAMFSPDHIEK